MTTRICKTCKRELPLAEFWRYGNQRGYYAHCRTCVSMARKKLRLSPPIVHPEIQGELPQLSQVVIAQLEAYKFEARHPVYDRRGYKRRAR